MTALFSQVEIKQQFQTHAKQEMSNQGGDVFNVVFLCIINIIFMVAGIFLNSVVIISLWRSRQLRKQLCYFMILVLSCFDLAVVSITHPFLIASTICFRLKEINEMYELARRLICFVFHGLSMFALFTLNVERFLAVTCPFFHQASVTKTRLKCFLALSTIIVVCLSLLAHFNVTVVHVLIAVFLSLFLLLFVYFNYKILIIAKSKRSSERVVSTNATPVENNYKISNLKNISTCSLVVGCFFVCSCPQIIHSSLRLAAGMSLYDRQVWLFNIWSITLISINSTLNCVIFFWRNSILRREGMKTINAFRAHVINSYICEIVEN